MQVGHAVSRNYLTIQPRGEGIIADLSGDEPSVLHDVPMSARQGVAGAVDLRVLAGGPVTVTVLAASPGVTRARCWRSRSLRATATIVPAFFGWPDSGATRSRTRPERPTPNS